MTHLAIASNFARALTEEQFAEHRGPGRAKRAGSGGVHATGSGRSQRAGSGGAHATGSGAAQPAESRRTEPAGLRRVLSHLVHVRG